MEKKIANQVQKAQRVPYRINPRRNTPRHILIKLIVNKVQQVQRVPYRINPRRNTPRHTLIKLTKMKHKERILKAAREK